MPESSNAESGAQLPVVAADYALPTNQVEAREVADRIARALRRASRKARAPASIISGGSGIRARKNDRAFRLGILASLVVFCILPILVASLYWGLIASNQYATDIKFTVRAGQSSPLDSFGGLLGLGIGQQSQDTEILADFVKGRAMVEKLDKALDLRRIYSRGDIDYFSRFDPEKSVEGLEKYWRKRITVTIENLSGIIHINVRAFTPEDSLALGGKSLEISEALVNDLSTRSRQDALAQSRAELDRAEARLQDATAAMRDARNTEGVLDAKGAGEALDKIVTVLRLEKLKLEQDLASQGALNNDAPQVRVIRARIASIMEQIEDYSTQIAGIGGAANTMADRLGQLSRKQIDLDLARQQYAQVSTIFQNARVNVETQQTYLALSLPPTLAQDSTYPKRWWEWSIIVFPALLIWVVLVAIAFMVRDNMAK